MLGVILATVYVCITSVNVLFVAPQTFLIKLLVLNFSFTAFGLIVNRVKHNIRCNPMILAAVWFPIGYFLIQYAVSGDMLLFTSAGPGLISGFSSLMGVILWASVILVGNSLVLLITKFIERTLFRRRKYRSSVNNFLFPQLQPLVVASHYKCPPNLRAPPALSLI
jgi:hypothetical protein